jgi:hypothetical protein
MSWLALYQRKAAAASVQASQGAVNFFDKQVFLD